MLPDRYLTSEFYRGILLNTLALFARQHFGDNNHYQADNATPRRARVVLDFLHQGNVTKMEQPGWISEITWALIQYKDRLIYVWRFPC